MTHQDREVQIDVTSRHQQVSEKTRAFVTERAFKLTRYNDRISRIQVILDEEHDQFTTEMVVHVDSGTTLVGKETGEGYRSAMDAVLEKMERQLKRDKEKRRSHKHDGPKDRMMPALADGEREPEETYDDVVKKGLSG